MKSFLSQTVTSKSDRNKYIFFSILLLVFISLSVVSYLYMNKFESNRTEPYAIKTVPYVGLHNNVDRYRQPHMLCDTGSAVISVVEYWQPQANEISRIFEALPYCRNYTLDEVTSLVSILEPSSGVGYEINKEQISLDDLGQYISESARTPLIAYLPMNEDQPSNLYYYPTVVVHAIDPEEETITFHDYWHGPNRTITFAEYEALQSSLPEELQNSYLVIQPENLNSSDYAFPPVERPELADIPDAVTGEGRDAEDRIALFDDLALAEGAYNRKMYDLAKIYFQRLTNNPLFDEALPKSVRVWELFRYADALGNGLHEYEAALGIVEQAEQINFNLDKGLDYFGPYDYLFTNNSEGNRDRLSYVYIIKGDVYRHQGRVEEAISAYETALEIFPYHQGPRRVMEELQQTLNNEE